MRIRDNNYITIGEISVWYIGVCLRQWAMSL